MVDASHKEKVSEELLLCICFHFLQYRSEGATTAEAQPRDEKTIERDNRRNCQQVYTSSPIKSSEKLQDAAGGEVTVHRRTCLLFMLRIVYSNV